MHFLSVTAVATLLSVFSSAAPGAGPRPRTLNHVLHEKRNGEPHQWAKHARAAAHEELPIRIGLRQRNLEHAERFILDVSDPDSLNFGKAGIVPSGRTVVNN
jgi:tripeptidyl-peptidase-1